MSKANILGVNVDMIRLVEVLERIRSTVKDNRRAIITYIHVMGLHMAYEQEWFRQFLNSAEVVFCDGMGVKLGGRLLGYDIPERFAVTDWIWPLVEMAETQGFSFYFLGNPPGTAEKAACRMLERFPGLAILGTQHGFFDKSPFHPENEAVIAKINAARPNILLVGLGMPAQERWLQENWERLEVNVAITCGAVFEYIAGELKRGPRWMTHHYMEWLARLIISPKRYGKRYLVDNPLFLYRIFKQKYLGFSR